MADITNTATVHTVEVDRSRYFDTDQLGVRAKWRVDGNLADSDALVSMLQNV